MGKDYSPKDLGQRKVAVIDLLTEDGEERFGLIVNNTNHWVREKDIQIVSHEKTGSIYAIIQYFIIETSSPNTVPDKSPKEVVTRLREERDRELAEAREKRAEAEEERWNERSL